VIDIDIPPTLRFAANAPHKPSGRCFPTMIAAVTVWPERQPCAVHRTFLDESGMGKASVEPKRMTLGPCHGGAVRLAEATERLMVGEGIETCLSAMQATGLPAWVALSTGGLQTIKLPPDVREVIILADGDDPGEKAAQAAARRFLADQRRVRIARPPKGSDFNDLLNVRSSSFQDAGQ
jgi:putative DNA primase/helicase